MFVQKKRASNFTNNEQWVLMELVKKYKSQIECKKSDKDTNKIKAKAWNELTEDFNSTCGEMHRDARTLRNKYENIKKRSRQMYAKGNLEGAWGLYSGYDGDQEENEQIKSENKDAEICDPLIMETGIMEENEVVGNTITSVAKDPFNHQKVEETSSQVSEETEYTSGTKTLRWKSREKKKSTVTDIRSAVTNKLSMLNDAVGEIAQKTLKCIEAEHELKMKLMHEHHARSLAIMERESKERVEIWREECRKKLSN